MPKRLPHASAIMVGMRMSKTPQAIRAMAPLLGADSRAVLAEVGLSTTEIEALKDSGAMIGN
jgi:crotonobetainyl-CoA:carnitine CoA-transferase CaiB-like acyl-CoA transferase